MSQNETQIKIGDKVRVIKSVWDDNREKNWIGWEGIVKATNSPYFPIFVFFPKARGKFRTFDFMEDELKLI